MKKVFLSLLLPLLTLGTANGVELVSTDGPTPSAKEVIIRKTDKTKKKDRDSFPDVSAVYSQSMNLVSVELFEVGPATVYVVDSRGQVVSSESTEGFEYESVSLRVPSRGDVYTLVIWGTYLDGEGTFVIE